jgi:propionate CoA-transferase
MIRDKITTADAAIALIRDGDVVSCSGFVGIGTPEALSPRSNDASSTPQARETSDSCSPPLPETARSRPEPPRARGLVRRAIGGHWSLVPRLAALATANRIEAYNLPLGIISNLYRDAAAHRAGTLSKVGLGTFVDPRQDGGRSTPPRPRSLCASSRSTTRNGSSTRHRRSTSR